MEAGYLRDGQLTETERDTLDERLDALDARLEGATVAITPRTRLDAIARELPASRLSAAQAQLRIEHGDLVRLAAAYERVAPTADERASLKSRLVNLETRARIVRYPRLRLGPSSERRPPSEYFRRHSCRCTTRYAVKQAARTAFILPEDTGQFQWTGVDTARRRGSRTRAVGDTTLNIGSHPTAAESDKCQE